jgi:Uma2 family endonuclease
MVFSGMSALHLPRMNVDEYLAWAEGRPGRYELYGGEVYQMAPERARHAVLKFAVQTALAGGIRRARLNCHMLPDGMTIRIDDHTAHEPDALVYCGPLLSGDALVVPNPMVVVEVLSPSTRHVDASTKMKGYFSVPSVLHYLIVDPRGRVIIHHARREGFEIATRIVGEGSIKIDPPGFEFAFEEVFSGPVS